MTKNKTHEEVKRDLARHDKLAQLASVALPAFLFGFVVAGISIALVVF